MSTPYFWITIVYKNDKGPGCATLGIYIISPKTELTGMDFHALAAKYLPEGSQPHDFQIKALEKLHSERSAFVVAPTGSGKSLIFVAAALDFDATGIAVIFAPLVALRGDHRLKLLEQAKRHVPGAEVFVLDSGTKRRLGKTPKQVVLVEPDCLADANPVGNALKKHSKSITLVVIDEIHLLLTWGYSFRPALRELPKFWSKLRLESPRILCMTAESHDYVVRVSIEDFKLSEGAVIRGKHAVPVDSSISGGFFQRRSDMVPVLVSILKSKLRHESARGVIFCQTRVEAHYLCQLVTFCLPEVQGPLVYHSGLTPQEKAQILTQLQQDNFQLVFATSALSTGVDFDLSFCVHFGMPYGMIQFQQEMGRIGRRISSTEDNYVPKSIILSCRNERTIIPAKAITPEAIRADVELIVKLCFDSVHPTNLRTLRNGLIASKLSSKARFFPKASDTHAAALLRLLFAHGFLRNDAKRGIDARQITEYGIGKASHQIRKHLLFVYQDRKALLKFTDLLRYRQSYIADFPFYRRALPQADLASISTLANQSRNLRPDRNIRERANQFHRTRLKETLNDYGQNVRSYAIEITYNSSIGHIGHSDASQGPDLPSAVRLIVSDLAETNKDTSFTVFSQIEKPGQPMITTAQDMYECLTADGHRVTMSGELPTIEKRHPNTYLICHVKNLSVYTELGIYLEQAVKRKSYRGIIAITDLHVISDSKHIPLPNLSRFFMRSHNLLLSNDMSRLADQLLSWNTNNRHSTKAVASKKDSRIVGLAAFLSIMRMRLLDYRVNTTPDLGVEPRLYAKPARMSVEAQEAFDAIMKYAPKRYVALNRYRAEDFVRVGFVPMAITQIDKTWNRKGRQAIFKDMHKDGLLECTEHIYFLGTEKEGTPRTYALNTTVFDRLREYDSYSMHQLINYLRNFSGLLPKSTIKALYEALITAGENISYSYLTRFGKHAAEPQPKQQAVINQVNLSKLVPEPPGLKKALARLIDQAGQWKMFEEWHHQILAEHTSL